MITLKKQKKWTIRYLSIRSKLILTMMVPTLSAILLLCSLFAVYEYWNFRNLMSEEFTSSSKMIADRSTAAILFNDKAQIEENISSFRLNEMVQLVCAYNEAKGVIGTYARTPNLSCPGSVEKGLKQFTSRYFHLVQPVVIDQEVKGYIYVKVSLTKMYRHLWNWLLTLFIFALLGVLLVYLMANILQKYISNPLLTLKHTVDQVAEQKDYSLRSPKISQDEIGDLTDAINNMISTIEQQNHTITQYAEELEDKVAYRTQALQVANKELKAFSYSVSHDLRAPLRAIDGFSQALEEDYGAQLDETAHDYLSRVRSASQKMGSIISSLLQLSRVSKRELEEKTFNLSDLVRYSFEQLQGPDNSAKARLILPDQIPITADPELMGIAIDNLISNAWKYSQYKPEIYIEVGCFKENDTTIYYVKDNGAGYDVKYAENLFTAFQRLHSPKEFEGTGIGLATVARIIHRHHGDIWSESILNEGATFYFTIHQPKPDHL